mgnify:CR=1 FL=1
MTETKAQVLRSRDRAYRAIQRGQLVRPDLCSRCGQVPPPGKDGRSGIHAHHHKGYAEEFALDVVWLCAKCHEHVHPSQLPWSEERRASAPSPKGRKLNLSDEERKRRSDRAKKNRPFDAPRNWSEESRKKHADRCREQKPWEARWGAKG